MLILTSQVAKRSQQRTSVYCRMGFTLLLQFRYPHHRDRTHNTLQTSICYQCYDRATEYNHNIIRTCSQCRAARRNATKLLVSFAHFFGKSTTTRTSWPAHRINIVRPARYTPKPSTASGQSPHKNNQSYAALPGSACNAHRCLTCLHATELTKQFGTRDSWLSADTNGHMTLLP